MAGVKGGAGGDVMMAYEDVQHRQAQGECVYIHIPACILKVLDGKSNEFCLMDEVVMNRGRGECDMVNTDDGELHEWRARTV